MMLSFFENIAPRTKVKVFSAVIQVMSHCMCNGYNLKIWYETYSMMFKGRVNHGNSARK